VPRIAIAVGADDEPANSSQDRRRHTQMNGPNAQDASQGDLTYHQPYKGSSVLGYVRSARRNNPQLDEWEAEIRAYAAERGYNLLVVLREEGVSAVSAHRPIMRYAVAELATNHGVGLIMPSPDHLGIPRIAKILTRQIVQCTNSWIEYLRPHS